MVSGNYVAGDLCAVREMLVHDWTLPGLSGGGAHVGTICDASFPTRLLAYWARDRADGRLPVEFVVQRQARDTARAVGLADCGVLAPGYRADVNFTRLGLRQPEMRFDLPGGCSSGPTATCTHSFAAKKSTPRASRPARCPGGWSAAPSQPRPDQCPQDPAGAHTRRRLVERPAPRQPGGALRPCRTGGPRIRDLLPLYVRLLGARFYSGARLYSGATTRGSASARSSWCWPNGPRSSCSSRCRTAPSSTGPAHWR